MKRRTEFLMVMIISALFIFIEGCSKNKIETVSAEDLREWVTYLSSDEMKGRANGSPEMLKAAEWIAGRFREYGLKPPPGQKTFFQEYNSKDRSGNDIAERNVIGYIEGADPELKKEYIIISAHFDHIGIGTPVNGDSIYNGADDNISGVSGVLGIARMIQIKNLKPGRSVVFIAFSGEELGLLGSKYYCSNPGFPLKNTYLNINFELLGHSSSLGRNRFYITGPDYSDFDEKLDEYNKGKIWQIDETVESAGRLFYFSDNRAFATVFNENETYYGVPAHTIAMFDGDGHVHKPNDESQYFDYENLASFIDYATGFVLHLAGTSGKISWTDKSFKSINELPDKE